MNNVKTVVLATRPSFLILSVSVIFMTAAIAQHEQNQWSNWMFAITLVGAVLAHAAVNLLNEYQDHLSGLDFNTHKTPFSGGSGSLQLNPKALKSVFNTFKAIVVLLISIGLWFVYQVGWQILPLGLAGLVIIFLYTRYITKHPWLCLIAPGLAFGPIMVMGCYFVLTGQFSSMAMLLSLVPFFMVNNLLLLNQVPDLQADKEVGRYNLLMKIGLRNGMIVFVLFEVLAFVAIILAAIVFDLWILILVGSVVALLALPMIYRVLKHYEYIDKLMPALRMNVIINILTPVFIGVSLWLT